MADEEKFKHDPEAGEDTKKLRLPFALCKSKGIEIQDWWTPRDAWNALKNEGAVSNVSEEYADYYRQLKKKKAKEYRKKHPERIKKSRLRAQTKSRQLSDLTHNVDKKYKHKDGAIAGANKATPMTFEKADSGNCNPFFNKKDEKTGVNYIGYRTNCQTCVATYIARRKGYDVRALPNLDNREIAQLSQNTSLAYKDKNGKRPEKLYKPYEDSVGGWLAKSMEPGEIFSVEFDWIGRNSGHIVTAEKLKNGDLRIYDPQTNYTVKGIQEIKNYFKSSRIRNGSVEAMNLTNCTLDEKFCDKIMKKSR